MLNANNSIYDKGVIVLGNHVQGLGIIRSLGRKGIKAYLLNEKELCIARFSRYCKKFIKIPPIAQEDLLLEFLEKIAFEHDLKNWIIIPTNDEGVAFLSKNKEKLEKYFIIPTPNADIIINAINKKLTYTLAEREGIPIPKTIYPENIQDLHQKISGMSFPCIIKPAIIHNFYKKTKLKVLKVNSIEELEENYFMATSAVDPSEIMVQEIIPGSPDNLYSFCSFFKDKKVLRMCIAVRNRQRPMDFGHGTTFAQTVFVPELVEYGEKLLKALNYYGLSEIEFKKDHRDGQFKLLEINARTWKWHTLAIRAGVDFPFLLYSDIINNNLALDDSFRTKIKWIDVITDIPVIIEEILRGRMQLSKYCSTLKGNVEHATLSVSDPLPFILELLFIVYFWRTR